MATLPFRKRHAFRDEKEVRILFESKEPCGSVKDFDINLGVIERIVVNPWLPREVFESIKLSIQKIKGCRSLNVTLSRMLTNKEWARLGDPDA